MKRNHWSNHLLGAFFAFLYSVCAVGCIVTGFELRISSEHFLRIFVECGFISLFAALFMYVPFGGVVLFLLLIPIGKYLWHDGLLWEQLNTIVYTISSHFHNVYGWPVHGEPISENLDLAIVLLAGIIILIVNFCVCRNLHILFFLPFVLSPPALCLITTDTLPEEHYLYLLIAGTVLLLLTDLVRRRNPLQGGVLTLLIAVPVITALALLFLLNPQTEYVSRAGEIQKETVIWIQNAMTSIDSVMNGNFSGTFFNQTLNLRTVGPKNNLTYSVMRVYTPYPGTLYLRGQDYDIYTGTAWESSPERNETFTPGSENALSGSIGIATYGVRQMLYVPYYSPDTVTLTGGFAANWDNLNTYSFPYSKVPSVVFGSGTVDPSYTELPTKTREWADAILQTILTGNEPDDHIVRRIQNYVQSSAVYDRFTAVMDSGYDDFSQWFLEKSDTGYCVHFATTAVILLRAAGIPARYVEGYMIDCQAEVKNIVTNQEAHAWVEYFDPIFSVWWILETTPINANPASEIVPEEEKDKTSDELLELPLEAKDAEPAEITETILPNSFEGISDIIIDVNEDEETIEEEIEETGNIYTFSGISGEIIPQKEKNAISGWLYFVVVIFLLITFSGQRYFRIFRKHKLWNVGTPNETALNRWKQLSFLANQMNLQMPHELDDLARKARFSQHILTPEDLMKFEYFRQQIFLEIKSLPWYRKFLIQWIYANGST